MFVDDKLLIAKAGENYADPVYLIPAMANRHGLIAGATGTGKTVTLKTMAQSFSDAGVPCFLADVKGDVSGMAVAGEASEKLVARLAAIGVEDYDFHACPVRFWDVYGEQGLPVRTTITEMGPVLLARLLGLSDVQEGVLNIAFHVADDQGLLLLDLKDLRSMVAYLGENADQFTTTYGQIATTSVGAIQRALLQLEDAGASVFFGEPALDIHDWLTCDSDGKGYINILDCVRLIQSPLLYSTFLLWMLSELYETMPEVGDADKPKICFFFDEAHLLFDDAPTALVSKVEQVVKLIRSKGVGVYFITQNPADIPDSVLAQLGNRVQHALRAYTPAEQKSIKAAADSFRVNPAFDSEEAITDLATGEALISFLDEDGKPSIVQRAKVIAPACSMGAALAEDKQHIIDDCELRSRYDTAVDRESAYELLATRAQESAAAQQQAQAAAEASRQQEAAAKEQAAVDAKAAREQAAAEAKAAREQAAAEAKAAREAEREKERAKKAVEKVATSALSSMSRSIGSSLARGILGAIKKGL